MELTENLESTRKHEVNGKIIYNLLSKVKHSTILAYVL